MASKKNVKAPRTKKTAKVRDLPAAAKDAKGGVLIGLLLPAVKAPLTGDWNGDGKDTLGTTNLNTRY